MRNTKKSSLPRARQDHCLKKLLEESKLCFSLLLEKSTTSQKKYLMHVGCVMYWPGISGSRAVCEGPIYLIDFWHIKREYFGMKITFPYNDGGSDSNFRDLISALWERPQWIRENVPLYVAWLKISGCCLVQDGKLFFGRKSTEGYYIYLNDGNVERRNLP